jgi:5-methylcytosine-specific restriction endonuclease McrA
MPSGIYEGNNGHVEIRRRNGNYGQKHKIHKKHKNWKLSYKRKSPSHIGKHRDGTSRFHKCVNCENLTTSIYCSLQCFHVVLRKKWAGRISIVNSLRHSSKCREWTKAIFERDNHTCQECGQWGGELQAHHIIPFSFIVAEIKDMFGEADLYQQCLESKELWDIDNGKTLCKKCHKKTDTYAEKAKHYKKVEVPIII